MPSFTRQHTHSRGFTLIEVMVALGIFTLVMLALVSSFLYAFKINTSAANQTLAAYAAQAQMERTLSKAYDTIATGTIEAKSRLATTTDHHLYPFWRQTDVAHVTDDLVASASDTGMKRIDVTVFWQSAFNTTEKTYTLTSLISAR